MTGPKPPAGVAASERPVTGCLVEWQIKTGPGALMSFRLFGPRPEETNRAGRVTQPYVPARVEIRTFIAGFGPDFEDPDELKRFAWRFLAACYGLADVLALGMPEPEPDPQRTIHDHLAETGTTPTIPTGITRPSAPEDEAVCPDDPDGLHHVGCGCDHDPAEVGW
jgi:hypothetical protein